jgi:hypothetical protein
MLLLIACVIGLIIIIGLITLAIIILICGICGLLVKIILKRFYPNSIYLSKYIRDSTTDNRYNTKTKFIPSELPVYLINSFEYIYQGLQSHLPRIHRNRIIANTNCNNVFQPKSNRENCDSSKTYNQSDCHMTKMLHAVNLTQGKHEVNHKQTEPIQYVIFNGTY